MKIFKKSFYYAILFVFFGLILLRNYSSLSKNFGSFYVFYSKYDKDKVNADNNLNYELLSAKNISLSSNFSFSTIELCKKWIILHILDNESFKNKQIVKNFDFLSSIYGWCILVVTENTQQEFETYKRKNIFYHKIYKSKNTTYQDRYADTYLFAIKNKAKYIYETDESYFPLNDALFKFRYENFYGLVKKRISKFSILLNISIY
jgi:hypothetical protein